MNSLKKGLFACLAFMFAASAQSQVVPTTSNVVVCVGESLEPLKEYATPGTEDPNGELVFYTESLLKIDGTYIHNTSVPGKYKYWVSQISSEDGSESEKQPLEIEVASVEKPIVLQPIIYQKSDYWKNGFKKPTIQDPSAIIVDPDCELVWYQEDKMKIQESEATPDGSSLNIVSEEDRRTYYVSQVNSLGCESELVPVEIMLIHIPVPSVDNVEVCEDSPKLVGSLMAEVNKTPRYTASDFELVWFKAKADGTHDESQEFREIELSPSIQTAGEYEPKVYTYYVLQRLITNPFIRSSIVPVTVTVYSIPRIKLLPTSPKCYGEVQDLNEMFELSPISSQVEYFDETGIDIPNNLVAESGKYEVWAHFDVPGTGEICRSEIKTLNVNFQKIDAEIEGSSVACAGSNVELRVNLQTEGLTENGVAYYWSNDVNSDVSVTDAYVVGLEKPGERMKVNLVVSSEACKMKVTPFVVTAGNGPLIGNIKFSEANNKEEKTENIFSNNITYFSCGRKVDVELSGVVNTDGGSYVLTGSDSDSGTFSSENNGSTTLSLGAGRYTLEYVNQCPTKFEFEIVDNSITSSSRNSSMTMCEGEPWSAEIVNIEGRTPPSIEWQKDGVVIPGETSTKLEFMSTKPSDSGVYSYSLLSAGCRFDSKIAMGKELTIKPYASFYESLFESSYEVPYGDSEEISVAVSESDIDVTWSDKNNGFSAVGTSVVIGPVEINYNFRVVADGENYCPAETFIDVFVDAKIHLDATLDTNKIKIGDSAILTVDTIGTGRILHRDMYELSVTELSDGEAKQISLTVNPTTGKLEAKVNPTNNASYVVNCVYGSQEASMYLDLMVLEPDGVKNIIADQNELVDVYGTNGALLRKQVEFKDALIGLQSGVYVVNGVKIIVK